MMGHGHWRMLRPNELDDDVKLSKGLIWRVIRFARPYRNKLLALLVAILLSSVLGVVIPPWLSKRIFDEALLERNLSLLNVLALMYLAAIAGNSLVQIFARWISSSIGEGLIFDLRVALFDHIQRMPIGFFTRTQTGALITRLNNDVIGAQRAVTETTAGVVQIVLDVTFALALMFALNWRLTLIALALVPVFLAPTRRMGKTLQRLIKRQMESNAAMNTQIAERFGVAGALLVKLFGSPRSELGQFGDRAGRVRDIGVRVALYGRIFWVAFGLVAAVGTVLVYWIGGRQVIGGTMSVGTIVAFIQLLTRLYAPVTMLSNVRVEVMTALVSFERVFEVLDFPSAVSERPGAIELVEPRGQVEFDRVWFRYPHPSLISIASLEEGMGDRGYDENAWVLREVSFTIPSGRMVALVGPTGAGKTTIAMLIPRLYDVTEGRVRVDGIDVRDLTLDSLRKAIGVVTQDPHLFHDTIRANLLYAKPDATEQELIDATEAARIHHLISSLPDGYETKVGERGYRLSGGEKQRLAIARLLLKDPAIMILDEATAHLDSESELLIQRALAEALAGRSTLAIAHRLSTIQAADEILVVDEGTITERGTHWELLDAGGLYEQLYRTQFERAAIQR
jgi:ATP-binding cassette subfamily B protein